MDELRLDELSPSPRCTYCLASSHPCLCDLSPLNFKHISASFFFLFALTVSAVFKDLIIEVPLWISKCLIHY